MKSDFYAAISQIAAERGIPKEAILEVMEKALVTAYKRTLGNNPPPIEVVVKLDSQTGQARVYAEKQVVDDVLDDRFEIDYNDARRFKSDVELGETIMIESTPNDFGRIAAQTAKQVILQGIKEVEREHIYGEFMDREIKRASAVRDESRSAAEARGAAEAEAMATEAALALAKVETRKVQPNGMIAYQKNRYGPLGDDLIGQSVQLRATPQKLYIYRDDRLLASYMLIDNDSADAEVEEAGDEE
jgi:hypothetical protein